MKLSTIVKDIKYIKWKRSDDPEITMISTDSRMVKQGAMFIAIQGYRDDGLRYLNDAVKKGARAVVVDERFWNDSGLVSGVEVCYTRNTRLAALLAARAFYRNPAERLTLIGVTGTNGKTTTTYLLEGIFKQAGEKPGVIGTISYRYGQVVKNADTTTPDPVMLQTLLKEMVDNDITHVIMEVSSHALCMERVYPPDFDAAIFTNLSQDHLDFHQTMEEYFQAKSLLFRRLDSKAFSIINRDDPYGVKMASLTRGRLITYGMKGKVDYLGNCKSLSLDGTTFTINGQKFFTHLIGKHNVYNLLASYALAAEMGVDEKAFARAVSKIKNIPGRLEKVFLEGHCHVFVDYAHTPDALDSLLDAALSLKKGRIITVFGCGGDRDKTKRPLMGHIVEQKSDIAIVTSDNPRTEDPLAIIADIKKGLSGENHIIIPDRREAIYRAVEIASKDDMVLIAGKGHEDYQILGTTKIHFDDREVAREALRELRK